MDSCFYKLCRCYRININKLCSPYTWFLSLGYIKFSLCSMYRYKLCIFIRNNVGYYASILISLLKKIIYFKHQHHINIKYLLIRRIYLFFSLLTLSDQIVENLKRIWILLLFKQTIHWHIFMLKQICSINFQGVSIDFHILKIILRIHSSTSNLMSKSFLVLTPSFYWKANAFSTRYIILIIFDPFNPKILCFILKSF